MASIIITKIRASPAIEMHQCELALRRIGSELKQNETYGLTLGNQDANARCVYGLSIS